MSAHDRQLAPQRRRDGPATRAKIEHEALHLFARKGVDATSVRDIALAVGVAEAALYRHFQSKEDIARQIFIHHYGLLARAVRAISEKREPFPRQIERLVEMFCRLFDETPDVFAFLLINQHAHLRFVPDDADSNAVEALRVMMRQAYQRQEIALNNCDLAASMALGVVVQPATFALYGRISRPLGAHADTLARAVKHILGHAGGGFPGDVARQDLAS
jgi:AcrR family transcriptional regulator